VLDFAGDLYGRHARLALARRLRPERAFPSIGALVTAMAHDIGRTREIVRRLEPPG
jgi:riboflavin kinase / FMN adenylyltransferase